MKSNHERSNGCLPPKKREILALEQRPVVVAAAAAAPPTATAPTAGAVLNDSPHTENLAWLASVASERCRSAETVSPRCPVAHTTSSSSSSAMASPLSAVPLTSLHTVYPTALTQQGGTIQYAQLAPNVQFISSGPYAGYISSQILPTSTHSSGGGTAGQRHHLEGYTTALVSPGTKAGEQHQQQQQQQQQFHIGLSPDLAVSLPSSTQVTGQYIQLDSSSPLTVSAPHTHLPLQLHPAGAFPHTLTLAPSQLLVQYAEPPAGKKAECHAKGQLNGEPELGKPAATGRPQGQQPQPQQQVQSYETRHILLPADYGQHPQGLHTSLLLVAQPNSTSEAQHSPGKLSLLQTDKGGICLGKPVSRASSFTSLCSLPSSEALKSSPHPVLQTSHSSSEDVPAGLYSSSQSPIIGYIASGGQQHALSYHTTLPQHLVMSGGQSLLIPVSGASRGPDVEASPSITALTTTTSSPRISTAMPHTYLATALSKCEVLGHDGPHQAPAQAQPSALSLLPADPAPPVMAPPSPVPALAPPVSTQASPSPPSSSSAPSASTAALPPFFMRGSIIQLADGELKRVEDLRTEDFIQSAEISSELKIDSSTVERIDCGQSPNAVLIQFAVGELKAQVCVEVLLEYPFFVFGQGWSSCCPDRTTQLFELSCAKLCVGDVCVSLTLRGLRNGAVRGASGHPVDSRVRNSQHPEDPSCPEATAPRNSGGAHAAGSTSGLLMKASRAQGAEREQAAGPPGVYCGAGHRASSNAQAAPASRDSKQGEQRTQTGEGDKPTGRKRRWSAPERDQTEKADEEPPAALPKPSFIPQEVKISIEGRSNIGS